MNALRLSPAGLVLLVLALGVPRVFAEEPSAAPAKPENLARQATA